MLVIGKDPKAYQANVFIKSTQKLKKNMETFMISSSERCCRKNGGKRGDYTEIIMSVMCES